VDVAATTLQDVLPTQRLKYHNAFQVNGFTGIIYFRLRSGLQCHCRSRRSTFESRLNEDGTAKPGFMNELLVGGERFGVLPYGDRYADVQPDATPLGSAVNAIRQGARVPVGSKNEGLLFSIEQPDPGLPSIFASNEPVPKQKNQSAMFSGTDSFTSDPSRAQGTTVVDSGLSPSTGPMNDSELEDVTTLIDTGYGEGFNDLSCPICMGVGFVGGYSVLNGHRLVLTHSTPGCDLTDADLDTLPTVALITGTRSVYTAILPAHVLSVDALRLWNGAQVIAPLALKVDGFTLVQPSDLRRFCDGRVHTFDITFAEPTTYTHLEIQLNSAQNQKLFDLPKTTESASLQDRLDKMQDFSVLFSPMVPVLHPGDLLAETTYNRVLQILNVSGQNTAQRSVLGWTAETRVVQPQELLSLLPRHRKEQPNSPVPAIPRLNRDL
jgi:hypothetical protein